MKSTHKIVAVMAATNFLWISHVSGYRFDNLLSFNWDIALMLTPYGIVKNLIIDPSSYLHPYYFERIQVPPGTAMGLTYLLMAIQWALSATLLYWSWQRVRR